MRHPEVFRWRARKTPAGRGERHAGVGEQKRQNAAATVLERDRIYHRNGLPPVGNSRTG
jgi:hypothetical protein